METVLNKLQEGVKYPRFERDATHIINELVEHITEERGIYSSDIEPNPNEHSIWFNTNTNELMIYNNHVWRDFSSSGGSSGWSVENALTYINGNGNLEIGNIKDKTFYILDLNINSLDYIEIPNLSDNIEFYIFMSSMPDSIGFPNSNIITNYDTIQRHTNTHDISYMSVLAHKIGITVEFSIINDKTDVIDKGYVYNTRAEKALISYIGDNNNWYEYEVVPMYPRTSINQLEIKLPSNIQGTCTEGSFVIKDYEMQIVYPPFKYETSSSSFVNVCIFRNPNAEKNLKVLSSLTNTKGCHEIASNVVLPNVAIFDKFNPDNTDTICTTYYIDCIDDANYGLIIKDNWYFETFNQDLYIGQGLSIIIDDFSINKDNDFFNTNNVYCCNDLIINNSSDDDRIKFLIERIVRSDFEFTNYYEETFFVSPSHSLTYTTNYKSKYIGIPHNESKYDKNLLIVIANKLKDNTEIIVEYYYNLDDLGNIDIVTIPENINILKNLIDINRFNNIAIYGTLTVDSIYDNKGLKTETYNYSINSENNEFKYERYDTPVIA